MCKEVQAQDPLFSQFYANPLYLAPSFTGAGNKGTRVALNYRDQWPAVPRAFTTYSFSFDHYFEKIRSGAGLFFMNDVQGSTNLRNTHIGGLYSFDFQINNDWHVRPGLHFSYFQTGIDYHRFVFYNQLDDDDPGSVSSTTTSVSEPFTPIHEIDLSTSVMAYNDLFWVGFNMGHMLRPNFSFYGDDPYEDKPYFNSLKYSFFGGARMRLRGNLLKYYKESITFAYLFESFEKFRQLSFGAYYHKNPLAFGLWYRGIPVFKGNPGHDALILLVGYELTDFIKMGYSYDLTVSGLTPTSGGAHEISFVWNFHIKERQKKLTALPCPDI